MDEQPKWTQEQLEMLEALRSAEEAEKDPALAPLAEALSSDPELVERRDQILAWDAQVSEAMQDVPVPAGLAEQILERLECGDSRPAVEPVRKQSNKRQRLWAVLAACASVAAVFVLVALLGRVPTLNEGQLRSIAMDRFQASRGAELEGEMVSVAGCPAKFPYSPDLLEMEGTQWRHVPRFLDAKAVAYDIPLGGGRKATLYVVRCRSGALPASPPIPPQRGTQGTVTAVWRGDGVVYVAVVEGGERAYRVLLRSIQRPIT